PDLTQRAIGVLDGDVHKQLVGSGDVRVHFAVIVADREEQLPDAYRFHRHCPASPARTRPRLAEHGDESPARHDRQAITTHGLHALVVACGAIASGAVRYVATVGSRDT